MGVMLFWGHVLIVAGHRNIVAQLRCVGFSCFLGHFHLGPFYFLSQTYAYYVTCKSK